jgi:hypothetical protein
VQTQAREVAKLGTGTRVALVVAKINTPAKADRVLLIATA